MMLILQSITRGSKAPSRVTTRGHHAGRRAPNAGRRYPAEILTGDEVRALIRACSSRAASGIRNRGLIVTLYRGGLRLGEALALRPKDVDLTAGTITILRQGRPLAHGRP